MNITKEKTEAAAPSSEEQVACAKAYDARYIGGGRGSGFVMYRYGFVDGCRAAPQPAPVEAASQGITQAQIDHIGEQWDGCMFDGIDIGESIRTELANFAAPQPEAVSAAAGPFELDIDMSRSVQRYEESCGEGGGVRKNDDGPFIRLDDVLSALSEATATTTAPAIAAPTEVERDQIKRMAEFIVNECQPRHVRDSNGPDIMKCGACGDGVLNNDGKAKPEQVKHIFDCMYIEAQAVIAAISNGEKHE